MIEEKIKSELEMEQIVRSLKKHGKKIVICSGGFDILHTDHIKSFQEAKKQGDILIVLLNSDKSVKSYKGYKRPINSQNYRAAMLAALESVDYVVIFNDITPNRIIGAIKPDVFVQGSEWGKNCIERKAVEENNGKIYVLKHKISFSTTDLIKKITDVYSSPDIKAVFLDRDGVINANKPEYVYKIKDFKFAPQALSGLKELSKTDYKIIIVTNQSGIAKGYYTEKDLKKLHLWLIGKLKRQKIRIDRIYYCPHNPEKNCICRKPKPGMILRAVKDFDISLDKSWLIGDDQKDIIMGREMNMKTIKIGSKMPQGLKLEPHYYANSLQEAVKIILHGKRN